MSRYAMVIDLKACVGCKACMAACATENQTPFWDDKFRTHVEDKTKGEYPDVNRVFLPRLCMHCENAPCEAACPTGATYITDDGIVKVNYDRCIGCFACVVACPYDARYAYESEDVEKNEELHPDKSEHTVPHIDKCTYCDHRLKVGLEPACVETCPTEARIFGDIEDKNSEVYHKVISKEAKSLRPELGTHVRTFYINK